MKTVDYTELVELAKKNDETAIKELFELTSQKGYYVALKYLKNAEDAQDILQDAYVSALTKLDQLSDPARFEKWLYQIIANKAKNYLVKNKPILFEQLESDEDESINFEESIQDDRIEFQPKENTDYQELKSALKLLIDELPDDQRMCLLMYYFEELSINEIADSLELNTNTIKSRLNYARTKIKDKVEELQKKGIRIYGIAPIPFLLWLLRQEQDTATANFLQFDVLKEQIVNKVSKEVVKKSIHVFGKTVSVKATVITGVSAAVAVAGVTGLYQYSKTMEYNKIYESLIVEFTDNTVYEYGSEFDEATLIKSHTGNIESVNSIDMSKIGEQVLKYVVKKDDVERSFEIKVEVQDTKKPILNLTQDSIEMTVDDKFDPNSYIKEAYDEVDGELKDKVEIIHKVDMKKADTYEVKYSLKDVHGLEAEQTLKVIVKEKKVTQPNDDKFTIKLDKLGLSMKIPAIFKFKESIDVSHIAGAKWDQYIANFGDEGLILDIHYYPYTDQFSTLEGNDGLRRKSIQKYINDAPINSYEVYDKGNYFMAFKQGIDYPISGSAWIVTNDNESISIRVEGKADDSGVYAINIRVNNYDRGFSLGIDGFKEKRIELAREIFKSIR